MGNSFANIIYGCKIPESDDSNRSDHKMLAVLRRECRAKNRPTVAHVGWHCTGDMLWFGVAGETVREGIGLLPDVPSGRQSFVWRAWTQLSPTARRLLDYPQFLLMVGVEGPVEGA